MARDYNDYEDLLKNFDDYTTKGKSQGSSRDIFSDSSSVNRDTKPDIERKEFVTDDFIYRLFDYCYGTLSTGVVSEYRASISHGKSDYRSLFICCEQCCYNDCRFACTLFHEF